MTGNVDAEHVVTLHSDGEGWQARCNNCPWMSGLFLTAPERRWLWWSLPPESFKESWLAAKATGSAHGSVTT